MSGVIIEELDNSSEESFDTPKSSHSADEFHEPAESFENKSGRSHEAGSANVDFLNQGVLPVHSIRPILQASHCKLQTYPLHPHNMCLPSFCNLL